MAWSPIKQNVLVPHDMTDASNEAVEAALTFVDDPTKVAVLHVVEPLAAFVTMQEQKNREAKEGLDDTHAQLKTRLDDAGFGSVSTHIRFGDAADAIAEFVQEHAVELIVMPSSRKSGVKRLLLGSVAEATLRRADCPVLVLRAPD